MRSIFMRQAGHAKRSKTHLPFNRIVTIAVSSIDPGKFSIHRQNISEFIVATYMIRMRMGIEHYHW